MATKTEWFLTVGVPLLAKVPEGIFFDTKPNGLEFQARTLDDVRAITRSFPGTIWQKTWREDLDWWEYLTILSDGTTLRIYAVQQAPPSCVAIFETRTVDTQVPIEYETRRVEKQVLVGWECP